MVKWLRSLWRNNTSEPFVSIDEGTVTFYRPDGTNEAVSWDELSKVEILTTDAGPFACDVFFVLHGDHRGCVVPQEAEGCEELLERLQELPGFNNQAVIEAMSCASNARFSAWQKEDASASGSG